jgi:hypothetical protein
MTWTPGKFLRATFFEGTIETSGYLYRGLRLFMVHRGSPKGRRPPTWSLIHLNSGHEVARIKGSVAEVFQIASEIAECVDWNFNGVDGWRNEQPDLPKLLRAVAARNPERIEIIGGTPNREIASQISAARA